DRAINALFGLGHRLYAFARAALNEFWAGFRSIAGSVISWIGNFARSIWNKVKSFFGIASPSSMFYDIGKNLMLGLFHGIKDHAHHAVAAVGAVTAHAARTGSAAVAQRYAASLLSGYGWPGGEMGPLINLWNQESGWNAWAVNPSSGAYGIPQSLGHGHPYNLGDYKAQIIWGLNYIRSGYGSPAAAWAHGRAFHWYGRGLQGGIFTRPTIIGVGDRPGGEVVDVRPAGQARGRPVVQFGDINVYDATDMVKVRQDLSWAVTASGLGS